MLTSLSLVPAFVKNSNSFSTKTVSPFLKCVNVLSSQSHIVFICCRQEAAIFHVSYDHLWQRKQSENGCGSVWRHKNHHSHCFSESDSVTSFHPADTHTVAWNLNLSFFLAETGHPELLVLQLRPKESCDGATSSQPAQPKYDSSGAGLWKGESHRERRDAQQHLD